MKQQTPDTVTHDEKVIPEWVKRGVPDWLLTIIVIALSLFSILVLFDDVF